MARLICDMRRMLKGAAVLGALALAIGIAPEARAGEASVRVDHARSTVRLLEGEPAGGRLVAGIEITLDPHWKTYWRMPGESGVPPHFDWSGSDNLAAAEVLWPAPSRFRDASGSILGYRGQVVFPLVVDPAVEGTPVRLDLVLSYASCHDICVPAQAQLSLVLDGRPQRADDAALIAAFKDRVPLPPEQVEGLSIETVEIDGEGDELALEVDVRTQQADTAVELIVESDGPFYFGEARRIADGGTLQRYRVQVDGAPDAGALKGSHLNFTVLQGDKGLTQNLLID